MKKLLGLFILSIGLFLLPTATTFAGDCKTRDSVDWHATITSAVFVRSDCPSGGIVGTVPGGEVIRILEVDRYQEFYLIETSVGTGFVFSSFLKDIQQSPKPGAALPVAPEPELYYENSIFPDLNPNHKYYDQIADVTERGIVSGTLEGKLLPEEPILRAQLAKILVEATTSDDLIDAASLPSSLYADVESDGWYRKYLQIAHEKGIMRGDVAKVVTVRPLDPSAGSEVAKMIAIAFELDIPAQKSTEQWYEPYMNTLKGMNVLPYDNATHQVTRAEMMYIVSKILEQGIALEEPKTDIFTNTVIYSTQNTPSDCQETHSQDNLSFNYSCTWEIGIDENDNTMATLPTSQINFKAIAESFTEYEDTYSEIIQLEQMSVEEGELEYNGKTYPLKKYSQHGWLYYIIQIEDNYVSIGTEHYLTETERAELDVILSSINF